MRAAIFDMDGTLIDTFPAILGCINDVLGEMGARPFEPSELRPLVGTFIGDIYASRGVDPKEARARHRVIYLERYSGASSPYPGAVAALESLKKGGVGTAVVTMRIGEIARSVLDKYGFLQHLDVVKGEDEVRAAKPDPEHIWAALRELGAEPSEAFMVGDTEYDMVAGLRAGCRPIGVSWGYGRPSNAGDVRVVDGFEELLAEINA
jgi:phosphoglycolate phosphatase